MPELRKEDGKVMAYSYYTLEKVVFDPSEGIMLFFGPHTVKLTGRNLAGEVRPGIGLLQGVIRHRVSWIRETDELALMQAGKAATVVEPIE